MSGAHAISGFQGLFSELRDAASSGGEIFAALYELDDDELIDLLCALGARAHVVLSNGSIKKKTETTEEARKPLVDSNTEDKPFEAPPEAQAFAPFPTPPPTSAGTIWFSRTHGKVDLQALDNEIKAAKAGILFLMFQPGSNGVLPTVEQAAQNPDLYVRGVVSELPSDDQHPADDQQHADVAVVRDDQTQHLTTPIIEPEGIAHPVSNWALGELTHADVRTHIGFAIAHSKTLVIDPFGDHPVVITGSHNFSEPASTKNDENFLTVKDDPPMAEAYAVHIMAAYDHYRYRAAQIENKGLARTDDWMAPKLAESTEELRVWGVRP